MKIKSFLLAGVFIVLSLFFAAPMNAKAANFTIDKYEVNMKVTKDNTYQIKEHIEVNFKSKSHGIYRDIPLVNDVKREDGSSNRIVARVENLDCGDEEYESSREGNNLHVRLGDEDVEITGKYEYNISYNYVMGNDVLPNEDEFYFNVIGTGWETTVSNVSFSIEMPETFDENNLGMSYGAYGESKLDGLYYSIDGNTIGYERCPWRRRRRECPSFIAGRLFYKGKTYTVDGICRNCFCCISFYCGISSLVCFRP